MATSIIQIDDKRPTLLNRPLWFWPETVSAYVATRPPPVVTGGLRFAPSTDEAFSKVTSYAIPLYPNCQWRLMTCILLFSDISGAYGLRERLFTLLFVPTESLFQILCHREDDDPLAIPDADVSMQTLDLTARLFLNNCFQQRARTFQKLPPHLLYQAVPLSRLRQTHFRWCKYAAQTDENHILDDECAGFCRSPAQVFFFKLNNGIGEGGLDFAASGLGHGKRFRRFELYNTLTKRCRMWCSYKATQRCA